MILFSAEQRIAIEKVKAKLHHIEDRKVVEDLVKLVEMLGHKIEAQKERAWGNDDYVRELQELNREYENRLGYY